MSTINLRMPDSIHQTARAMAKKDHISISQFVNTAVAEKISAIATLEYLSKRARRAPSRKEFERILAKTPSREPIPADRR